MNEHEIFSNFIKGISDSVAEKIGAAPAKTFNTAWEYFFGGFHAYVDKISYERQLDVEKFKESLNEKIIKIPSEHVQDPQLSIIGPAIESTKYYIHDEEIRELFTNLLAKSLDNRFNDDVNHAFVEIIKQLSPIDAYILKKLNTDSLAAGRYKSLFENSGHIKLNDFFIIDHFFNAKQTAISLNNLERLGLIDIPIGTYINNDNLYIPFYQTQEYIDLTENYEIAVLKKDIDSILKHFNYDEEKLIRSTDFTRESLDIVKSFQKIDLEKSKVNLTSFGNAFNKVCLY